MDKQKIIKDYYIENPNAEIRHRRDDILSAAIPTAVGMSIAAPLISKLTASPAKAVLAGSLGTSGAIGFANYLTSRAINRNKVLKEMGIDESLLGSYLQPFREKIRL